MNKLNAAMIMFFFVLLVGCEQPTSHNYPTPSVLIFYEHDEKVVEIVCRGQINVERIGPDMFDITYQPSIGDGYLHALGVSDVEVTESPGILNTSCKQYLQ